jgi:DNA-binding Lrp family transcriptional regulator
MYSARGGRIYLEVEVTRARMLDRLTAGEGFPVSPAPYCDLGDELGLSEIEALALLLELRETGEITRIGATFPDDSAVGFCSSFDGEDLALAPVAGVELTCDEAELLMLLSGDLPYGEHPYAELAAELQMRGIEADEAWVLERVGAWMESGVVLRLGAEV